MIDFDVIGRLAYEMLAPALPVVTAAVTVLLVSTFFYVTFKRW